MTMKSDITSTVAYSAGSRGDGTMTPARVTGIATALLQTSLSHTVQNKPLHAHEMNCAPNELRTKLHHEIT